MKAYQRTSLYNQPVRLTQEQMADPDSVLNDFFSWYHLDDLRQMLWEWMQAAMITDNGIYETSKERSNLLFFYRNMELLVEAAYLIRQQRNAGKEGK